MRTAPVRRSLARACALFLCALPCAIACAPAGCSTPVEEAAPDGAVVQEPTGTPDSGDPADATSDVVVGFPDSRGPGAFGALPSGYCCAADSECRGRRCADVGGGNRMCLDTCYDDLGCRVPGSAFSCKPLAPDGAKRCQPPAGLACVPRDRFVRGRGVTGSCCANVVDAQLAGAECASNMCSSFADGPYICTNHCAGPQDCPNAFTCFDVGDKKICAPTAAVSSPRPGPDAYTCN